MAGKVDIQGADNLARTLRNAGKQIGDLEVAHGAAAGIMASAVSSRAPRRTGRLASSVSATTDKGAVVNVTAPYAGPVHWGWEARKIPENRWATDAARATEPVWFAVYQKAVSGALAKVKGI